MSVTQLSTRRVQKIWGRRKLGLGFSDVASEDEPIGEIWYEAPRKTPDTLLVKYLFTSEKLSVQVHPNDEQAKARGHKSGKEECWLILDAEPDAKIGIGLTEAMDGASLRTAAENGSIEKMLDWVSVKPGDVFYLAAGTIHAIGAGISLVEIQQNVDLTYRLYDYGRPRKLHLEDAVAVAKPRPWVPICERREVRAGRSLLAEGRKFVMESWEGGHAGRLKPADDRPIWIIPLQGVGSLDSNLLIPGSVWTTSKPSSFTYEGDVLMAYPGPDAIQTLFG